MHVGKLEFLALKWAVTEKFRDYLYYSTSFTVYTDNNPLTYMLSSAKLSAVGHRWVVELADFNYNIKYRPAKSNIDVDVLSRLPLDPIGSLYCRNGEGRNLCHNTSSDPPERRSYTLSNNSLSKHWHCTHRASCHRFSFPTIYFRRNTKSSAGRPQYLTDLSIEETGIPTISRRAKKKKLVQHLVT